MMKNCTQRFCYFKSNFYDYKSIPQIAEKVPDEPYLHFEIMRQVMQTEFSFVQRPPLQQVERLMHSLIPLPAIALPMETPAL